LRIYDLSGALVRQVGETETLSGTFEFSWDGRDEGARMVSPGVFMYQVDLHTDGGRKSEIGVVAVAY